MKSEKIRAAPQGDPSSAERDRNARQDPRGYFAKRLLPYRFGNFRTKLRLAMRCAYPANAVESLPMRQGTTD
jgi:hypothetical protein